MTARTVASSEDDWTSEEVESLGRTDLCGE